MTSIIIAFGLGIIFALLFPIFQGLVELVLVKIEYFKTKISIKAQKIISDAEKTDNKKIKIGFSTNNDEDK